MIRYCAELELKFHCIALHVNNNAFSEPFSCNLSSYSITIVSIYPLTVSHYHNHHHHHRHYEPSISMCFRKKCESGQRASILGKGDFTNRRRPAGDSRGGQGERSCGDQSLSRRRLSREIPRRANLTERSIKSVICKFTIMVIKRNFAIITRQM